MLIFRFKEIILGGFSCFSLIDARRLTGGIKAFFKTFGSKVREQIRISMKRSGYADLPLHLGRVPHWLAHRMASLGGAIAESIIISYGKDEFLERLADPFWFQAFGCVLGMDWHSSGITTSVVGALKRAIGPKSAELGLYVCGGRGRHSRNTPAELVAVGEKTGLDADRLVEASRLSARVDNNAVVDGFQLYLHSFIVTSDGKWVVIQQGMNGQSRLARRYHWHSAALESFVRSPHSGIAGPHQGEIINLVDREEAVNLFEC